MIRALIFDLDGTLVQTESLKARSYALAVRELCAAEGPTADEVVAAYADFVGRSRRQVAREVVERFELEPLLRRVAEDEREAPWETLVNVRLRHYEAMLEDQELVWGQRRQPVLDLLERARAHLGGTALTTTSSRDHAEAVLAALGLADGWTAVITADEVEETKPDPEAYLLALDRLGVRADEAVAVEDSPAGAGAAVAAGLRCIGVTNRFTRGPLHKADLLDERWIVDDDARLSEVVDACFRAADTPPLPAATPTP